MSDRKTKGNTLTGIFIVTASGLTHILLVGLARCMGILNMILIERFGQSYAATAMVFSLFSGIRTLTGHKTLMYSCYKVAECEICSLFFLIFLGPICSMLIEAWGCRIVAFIGGSLLFLGLCVSAFATQLWQLYFSFGVLSGEFFHPSSTPSPHFLTRFPHLFHSVSTYVRVHVL